MAGTASDESGVGRSTDGISSGERGQSGEALAEWRSCEQVENGTPSTSPPYWDTDDDDDGGPKPSELYGKYTWKIENFSQINKRELRSNAFEVGGYKWYILIYPQGCDVCNHLSLFLCVANHDKLLPGWSHFAQFTIAVVNKDPKKSKYSDTLHRFWKKEHDWGWKKFMELSKVLDGFIELDTLIIKAQVQVIREKADRPFRCLDCQYRRELVRVYLTNVEQICRRFVEERRGKLEKLIKDKARWPSFCTFWLGIDQNARRRMSREKTDVILKVAVKHFFIEKEVTSTLVMDSLYSGLKALEGQSKSKKARLKLLDSDETTAPVVRVEKDTFVLVDDVLLLLERAALEPLPPKEDKGPQNRTKEGSSGEDFHKDSIERDERRLTELGRRTVEIFVLAHIFSNKIEVAYQEAVALKRQEELIREEEAAWQVESEQKAKRGATEKEKKSKKKQAKQKRNNRKGKEKGREEKIIISVQDKGQSENQSYDVKNSVMEQVEPVLEKSDTLEDVSDVSDSVDDVVDVLQPDSEERDASPVNWDTDTSEIHPSVEASSSGISGLTSVQNGTAKKSPSIIDDSSSTCSTDSVPSVVMNGPYKGNSLPNYNKQKSPSRGKNHRSKVASNGSVWANEMDNQPFGPVGKASEGHDVSASSKSAEPVSEVFQFSNWPELKKEEEFAVPKKDLKKSVKDQVDVERSKEKTIAKPSSPKTQPKINASSSQPKPEYKSNAVMETVPPRKTSSKGPHQIDKAAPLVIASQVTAMSEPETQKAAAPKTVEIAIAHPVPVVSRPSSAPITPLLKPIASVASTITLTAPLLSRSMSAAGRLAPDSSTATQSYVPQSYRNAIIGNPVGSSSSGHLNTPSSGMSKLPVYSHQPTLASAPVFLPQSSERIDSVTSGFPFGMVSRDILHSGSQWIESSQRDTGRNVHTDTALLKDIQNLDPYSSLHRGSREHISEFNACTSGRQTQAGVADEFPHLDIINELLDDEYGVSVAAETNNVFQSHSNRQLHRNQQYTFVDDLGMAGDVGSTSSSYRFERSRSYQDEVFQRNPYEQMRDYAPQASPLSYPNGQMEGMIPNHWQVAASDLSLLGVRNAADGDGQTYYNPDYSNMSSYGVSNYTMFRPSNGH